jgi:putative Holliday junction resolvase
MNLLGIDYGEKKIGLALASGPLSEPIGVIKISNFKTQIPEICQEHKVEKIVVGISEGKMAAKTRKFAQGLKAIINLPIEFQDETLTTQEARSKMKQAGKRIRGKKEDAFAAALILQSYLDKIKE